MMRSLIIAVFVLFYSSGTFAQHVAVVGAMPEEIRLLTEALTKKEVIEKSGVTFYKGKLNGQKIVVLKSGVGKVNAAYSTTILLENFPVQKVIFIGVAGGLHPNSYPGDMVIGEAVFHHDYARHLAEEYLVNPTRNPTTNELNPLYFPCDTTLVALAQQSSLNAELVKVDGRIPKIFSGNIATGDVFVSNSEKAKWLYEDFNALATEMEGAALGQICYQRNIPFIVIRSCSDNANNQAHLDFGAFMKPAAENSIRVVMGILTKM
jgi:adenosylhomocysteine nucleosidase